MTIETIKCVDCDYLTDIDTISEHLPTDCPECRGEIVNAYTGEKPEYLEEQNQ